MQIRDLSRSSSLPNHTIYNLIGAVGGAFSLIQQYFSSTAIKLKQLQLSAMLHVIHVANVAAVNLFIDDAPVYMYGLPRAVSALCSVCHGIAIHRYCRLIMNT